MTSTEVFYNLPSVPAESIKYDDAKPPQVSDRVRFGRSSFYGKGGGCRWWWFGVCLVKGVADSYTHMHIT